MTFEREFLHVLLIALRENLHTVYISNTTYLSRLVNVVSECPLTFTGVKFGTKEPKTPVLPYTLEHVLFLFKNRIINLLQTFRKIRSDFWKNMYEYVQKLRQFCTTIIAEDWTMDDFGKYCQRNIEEFVSKEL